MPRAGRIGAAGGVTIAARAGRGRGTWLTTDAPLPAIGRQRGPALRSGMAEPAPPSCRMPPRPSRIRRRLPPRRLVEQFETILAIRGDAPSPRMYYLDGELELMAPSQDHEKIKPTFGRLVEAGPMIGRSSWTASARGRCARAPPSARGPDECSPVVARRTTPTSPFEVVWTSWRARQARDLTAASARARCGCGGRRDRVYALRWRPLRSAWRAERCCRARLRWSPRSCRPQPFRRGARLPPGAASPVTGGSRHPASAPAAGPGSARSRRPRFPA